MKRNTAYICGTQMTQIKEKYMHRCLQLAALGLGKARPNPVVGSVLVHKDRIIGEGYHHQYGGPHAEVECIKSVAASDAHLVADSEIYVSLEPCAHFGKTPPCADLIIAKNIPKVIVGCRDPFKEVDGKGIEKLLQAGIAVSVGMLESECREINRRFFTFHIKKRPYVILKWAQSKDGRIAAFPVAKGTRTLISNDFSNRLVHKWRSEEAAIMVGTNTAIADNPTLTTRLWTGKNPARVLLDMNLRAPSRLHLFAGTTRTIVFNQVKEQIEDNIFFVKLDDKTNIISQVCDSLYRLNVQSLLVEGGTRLLQSFIGAGIYDEIRIVENTTMHIGQGVAAPSFGDTVLRSQTWLGNDIISTYRNINT